MIRKKIECLFFLFALVAGVLCFFDTAAAEEEPLFQLEELTVTAERFADTVSSIPGNVTVISAAELNDKGARTLAEALTGTTGAGVKQFGGTGQMIIPQILGTDKVVVLLDGKRLNLPQGLSYGYGGVDLSTILLGDNVDRIEIVRGGASTLYGADAVGGVINIITRKGLGSVTTKMTAAGGNYGARVYSLATSGQASNTHWFISGLQDKNDGQRINSSYKSKNFSVRLDQDLTAEKSLTFNYDYYNSHAGIPGSLLYPSQTDYQDISHRNWSVSYSREHSSGSSCFRFYENYQVYSGENYGTFRHENTVRALEYSDNAKINSKNLLTWGYEWRKDEVVSTGEGNISHNGITNAAYFQDQYSINTKSKFNIGLRRDDNSLYGIHWLPQIAYLYQASPDISCFANWAKVFKAPKFDDLFSDDGWGNTGNSSLKPETGWTAELGAKLKMGQVSEMTVTLFKRDIIDAIRWIETPSDFTFHPQNIDRLKSNGVNTSFETRLSPTTIARLGYTYLDSRNQNGIGVGDARHSFETGLNIHTGKITQSFCGVYRSQNGASFSRVAGRFVINTNTTYQINENMSLFLTINNLLDREYEDVKYYPANGRTILLGIRQKI